ncbi:MAG: DegT/DnrJ/EryC1/StrS aminotransferase family protein [Rugosibacter sp.]|nr:MAG: DegT/DnrJ/EryC1/StrS aminotransferase family protein [Rugosibacter sp.]
MKLTDTIAPLAIEGGTPVRKLPFAPWPYYAPDEIEAVTSVLASGKVNYWTGEEGRRFEQEYATHVGVRYALALMNGTVALELALRALGIGPGDDVITTSRTFIASASAIVACGAKPVLADVDRVSQNLTAETVKAVLTNRTKAIIVVHLAGWPCEMDSIMTLAREHGLKVIEDCAQAHGATYNGRPVGSFGNVAAFSFCQDKIITTGGEGGMLVTDDQALWEKAWAYKDHGKSHAAVYRRSHPPGFRWLHESFGTNWRMTEMQATIGRRQLTKLSQWVKLRQHNAALLEQGFASVPGLRLTLSPPHIGHAYYRYYVFLDQEQLHSEWNQLRIIDSINAEGITCFSGSCSEIYREKAFTDTGLGPAQPLPVAQELGQTSLAFLVHPTLSEADMYDTIAALTKVMRIATQKVGAGDTARGVADHRQ